MAIKIVTDSTGYIKNEILERYGIEVVPLYVNFKGETLTDGAIDSAAFFRKIKEYQEIPSTSQPSPGDFVKVFERIVQEGNEIISIHISSGISGTVESAATAARMVDESRITIFDSYSTSAGLAMLVIAAAQAAGEGKTKEEIMALLKKFKNTLKVMFVPETLEYLKKGGRIGGAQALLGTLLQIKPVLHLHGGRIEPFYKVRTMKKALEKIVSELPVSGGAGLQVAVMSAESPGNVKRLIQLIQERLPGTDIDTYELSPVIATHIGPVVGLVFLPHV